MVWGKRVYENVSWPQDRGLPRSDAGACASSDRCARDSVFRRGCGSVAGACAFRFFSHVELIDEQHNTGAPIFTTSMTHKRYEDEILDRGLELLA